MCHHNDIGLAVPQLAICLQHEMDHLDGKLFVDYLSPLKRQRIREKLSKIAKQEARNKS